MLSFLIFKCSTQYYPIEFTTIVILRKYHMETFRSQRASCLQVLTNVFRGKCIQINRYRDYKVNVSNIKLVMCELFAYYSCTILSFSYI